MSEQIRGVTAEDVLDLKPGIGEVQSTVVFEVLDKDLKPLFEIHPVTDKITISADSNSRVKRKLSGFHLTVDEAPLINVLAHRLRPSWVVQGEYFPMGVFLFSDANRPHVIYRDHNPPDDMHGLEFIGTLFDQTVIVDQGHENSCSVPKGASVTHWIFHLLEDVGLTGSRVAVDPSSARVSEPIAWRSGTSRYQMLEELCALAGFYPPYFDNYGVMRCRTAPTSLTLLTPDHTYNPGPSSRILSRSVVDSDDLVSAPNRYLVVNTSAAKGEIVGIYDLPASAPQSYANRGYRVVQRIDAQGIENSAQARNRAKIAALTDYRAFSWTEFESTPDPRHDLFGIVEFDSENCREVSFKLRCAPGGPMDHKLRKIYDDDNAEGVDA